MLHVNLYISDSTNLYFRQRGNNTVIIIMQNIYKYLKNLIKI